MRSVSLNVQPTRFTLYPPAILGMACHWSWVFLVMFAAQYVLGGPAEPAGRPPMLAFTLASFLGAVVAPVAWIARPGRATALPRVATLAVAACGAACTALALLGAWLDPAAIDGPSGAAAGLVAGLATGLLLTRWLWAFTAFMDVSAVFNMGIALVCAILVHAAVATAGSPVLLVSAATACMLAEGASLALSSTSSFGNDPRPEEARPGRRGFGVVETARAACLSLALGFSQSILRELSLSGVASVGGPADIAVCAVSGCLVFAVVLMLLALVLRAFEASGLRFSLLAVGLVVVLLFFLNDDGGLIYPATALVGYLLLETFAWSYIVARGRDADDGGRTLALLVLAAFVGQDTAPFANGFAVSFGESLNLGSVTQPMLLMLLLMASLALAAREGQAEGGAGAAGEASGDAPATRSRVAEEERRAWAIGQLRERYLLTERETDVVDIFARGRSVESIGRQLGVSENTVKTHLRNVYRKTSVHSREELLNLIEEVMEEGVRR